MHGKIMGVEEAIGLIKDGDTVAIGGFVVHFFGKAIADYILNKSI